MTYYFNAGHEFAVSLNGQRYVIPITVNPNGFYIKSADTGAYIQVGLDTAAELFTTGRAWWLLNRLYEAHNVENNSQHWQELVSQVSRVVTLETISSLIPAVSAAMAGHPAALPNAVIDALRSHGPEFIHLVIAAAGTQVAAGRLESAHSQYLLLAQRVNAGNSISFQDTQSTINNTLNALSAGSFMTNYSASIADLSRTLWDDLVELVVGSLEAIATIIRPDLTAAQFDDLEFAGEIRSILENLADFSFAMNVVAEGLWPELRGYPAYTSNGLAESQRDLTGSAYVNIDIATDYLGTGGNDALRGGSGNDTFAGGDGHDTFQGRGGSDQYYGGSGTDTVQFDDARAGYALSREAGTGVYLVKHIATGHVDRLVGIEQLRFAGAIAAPISSFDWSGGATPPPPPSPPPVQPPSPPPPPTPGDDFGNSAATAHHIASNTAFAGSIETQGDQDWFAVTLQAGVQYGFSMAGGSYGGRSGLTSPHLYLRDAAGEILAHGAPQSTNSIFQFTAQTSGVYYVQARSHGDQGTGAYGLAVTPLGTPPSPPPPDDDEPARPVRLDLDAVEDRIEENDGHLIYRVEYRGDLTEDIVIGWELTGAGDNPINAADVAHMSGTVTLREHDDDGYVTIRIVPTRDSIDERDEQFELTIRVISGDATISDNDAWGTIVNDDAGRIHPDIDEHSNTFAGATAIGEETWNRGFINTAGDVDFFAVTLVAGATYEWLIIGDNDTSLIDGDEEGFIRLADPQAALYDSNFNLITSNFDEPSWSSVRAEYEHTATMSGTYYVAVREDGHNDIGQYFLRMNVTNHADDYAADASTTGLLVDGQLGMARNEREGDVDWFRVTMTAGESYSVFAIATGWSGTFIWPGNTQEFEVRIRDAAGNSLAGATEPDGINNGQYNQLTFVAPTTGDYFISVANPESHDSDQTYVVGFNSTGDAPSSQPVILQPGPAEGFDAFFRDVQTPSEAGTDGETLQVGGFWGGSGSSASALRFDLEALPGEAEYAAVEIYLSGVTQNGNSTTRPPISMLLGALTADWDETSPYSTIDDYDLQSWLSAPAGPGWYRIEITDLYNQWQDGSRANYGFSLLPVDTHTTTNSFYSSDYLGDATLRPRLIVHERTPGALAGTSGHETVAGTDRADILQGLAGDDLISGGRGADVLEGGVGADFLDGGDGYDTATYVNSTSGVSVNLAANEATGGEAEGDSLINIENVTGSAFDDLLIGNHDHNELRGGGGDDVLRGGGGADILVGGEGSDTVDYASAASSVRAQLNTNASTNDGDGGTDTFASIENLTGSAFNDTLIGNGGVNVLRGGLGYDVLIGLGGNDVLWGGAGAANQLQGGLGDDLYVIEANDTIFENEGGGTDTVEARIHAYALAANVENLVFGGTGNFAGTGNALSNVIIGGVGDDVLRGRGGIDLLNGGTGIDMADYAMAGAGVTASLTQGAATNDGDGASDTLLGIENLTGSAFSDSLTGSGAVNLLDGGAGNDQLSGLNGDDILRGGAGVDVLNGGGGIDTADYSLAIGGVRAQLNGNAAIDDGDGGTDTFIGIENLTGSAFDDTLIGDAGGNVLRGGLGSDTLIGLAGNDVLWGGYGALNTLQGGLGNDIYVLEAMDTVIEFAGEGTDTVDARINAYALGANIENLIFGGVGSFTGTGNALANTLTGGAGADILRGRGGNDTLIGGLGIDTADYSLAAAAVRAQLNAGSSSDDGDGGADIFVSIENLTGSAFDDTLIGDAGGNVLRGGLGSDTLLGLAGNDVLWGGRGAANQLQGGLGDDLYMLEVNDTVVELAGEGIDTVESRLNSYTLGLNIENLSFGGAGNFTGTGNALANVLTGGTGADVLRGRGGNDTLVGGGGIDTADYGLAAAGVRAQLNANAAVNDGDGGTDTFIDIENLTGSAFNDVLIGDGAANVLRGGLGSDTLLGLAGNDVLWGGAGQANTLQGGAGDDLYVLEASDSVFEVAGEGVDTVDARINTYLLSANVENLIFGGVGDFTGTGNALANILTGGAGADVLRGRGGNDTLIGGDGIDTADYSQAAAGVRAQLNAGSSVNDGDGGADTLVSIENLTGSAFDDTLIGDASGSVLRGGLGSDTLIGLAGNDILAGGQGAANQLQGGLGDDLYILDARDTVVELAGQGTDTIECHIGAYTLGANVENMYYVGSNKFHGTGNALNNVVTGGIGDDILKGMGGNDRLFGGAGHDQVHFRGSKAQYTVTSEGSGYRIVDSVAGRDGSTFVDSIETLKFLTGNTTTTLVYSPGPASLEPGAKNAGEAQVLPGLTADQPLVLPGLELFKDASEPLVLPGLEDRLFLNLEARLALAGGWMVTPDSHGRLIGEAGRLGGDYPPGLADTEGFVPPALPDDQPLVLPGLEPFKDAGVAQVLPDLADTGSAVTPGLSDDQPLVLPGIEQFKDAGVAQVLPGLAETDGFVLPALPDDQPLILPGIELFKDAGEPLILPGPEDRLFLNLEARLALSSGWMATLDEQGRLVREPGPLGGDEWG